jgi:drug/metabolite transporter (DMT)-like permease
LTKTYENYDTKEQEKFSWAAGFLVFPCGICYIIGAIINKYTIPAEEQIDIPLKNSAICGVTVAISTLTYTYAIYMTNFPVVMMFKSCNILSVILVGIMCSRVKDKKLKLGIKKLVVGIIVTLGILVFKLTDPGFKTDEKKTELMGIALLLASLMADGFLPDFQAQIKSEYKPKPM